MIMESAPRRHITYAELEQRQDLTKIISDGAVKGPHDRRARRTDGQSGSETGSHQLQSLRNFHDRLLSAATG
jgi:hypothetical protein